MLKFLVIKLYRLYFYLKKIIRLIFPAEKFKLIYLFINKYIIHIIVILLALLISFTNIFSAETKAESFGEKSILYALATGSDLEDQYIEESLAPSPSAATSYLETQPGAISQGKNTTTLEQEQLPISGTSGALIKPEMASIEAAKPHRDKIIDYTVLPGDTISSIADNFGIDTTTILWENNLKSYSLIKPGQTLKILPVSGVTHKVVAGDNLVKIAKKYKADEDKIIEFNDLADQSDISVGQILIIPEGQPYYPPVPRLAPLTQIFEQPFVEPKPGEEGKMLWPNGCRRITQYFSWHHGGVDIACPAGTPIRAADDGIVIKVAYMNTGYGHHVDIDHGQGKTTRYGHMTQILVKEGQTIKRGDVIGLEGSTGRSTGPHLHFEVRFWGKVYNPLNYIR